MVNVEILSQIKKAEEDTKQIVSLALDEKKRKVQEAKEKARVIKKTAEHESDEYIEKTRASVKETIEKEREEILAKGTEEAELLKPRSSDKLAEATDFLVNEFERAVIDA